VRSAASLERFTVMRGVASIAQHVTGGDADGFGADIERHQPGLRESRAFSRGSTIAHCLSSIARALVRRCQA